MGNPMITPNGVDQITHDIDAYLAKVNAAKGTTTARADIATGRDAWNLLFWSDAYRNHESSIDGSAKDAHYQTVLEKIMLNAVFRDRKRY